MTPWRAACSCGWEPETFDTHFWALDASIDHRVAINRGGKPEEPHDVEFVGPEVGVDE